jgi:hypothetical protein
MSGADGAPLLEDAPARRLVTKLNSIGYKSVGLFGNWQHWFAYILSTYLLFDVVYETVSYLDVNTVTVYYWEIVIAGISPLLALVGLIIVGYTYYGVVGPTIAKFSSAERTMYTESYSEISHFERAHANSSVLFLAALLIGAFDVAITANTYAAANRLNADPAYIGHPLASIATVAGIANWKFISDSNLFGILSSLILLTVFIAGKLNSPISHVDDRAMLRHMRAQIAKTAASKAEAGNMGIPASFALGATR